MATDKKNDNKWHVAAYSTMNFLWALCCTLFVSSYFCTQEISFSNSHFSVIAFLLMFLLFSCTPAKNAYLRKRCFTGILGLIFSFLTTCGLWLESEGSVPYLSAAWLASVLLFARVYSALLSLMWWYLEKWEKTMSESNKSAMDFVLCRPYVVFFIILLCWLPCYLSTFPGGFRYDAEAEFNQLANGFDSDFPLLHSVLIIGVLNGLHHLTGSYNVGIAVFTILQMLFAAGIFANVVVKLRLLGFHPILCGIALVYFACMPVIHMLVTCTVRDVLFSTFLTYLVFQVYELHRDRYLFFYTWKKPVLLGATAAVTLLLRNNGIGKIMVIALVFLSGAIGMVAGKTFRKGVTILSATAMSVYLLLNGGLVLLCQPESSDAESSMSLMTQTLTRAYVLQGENWPDEDREEYEAWFVTEGMNYTPENGDSTKFRLKLESGQEKLFFRFWIKIGLSNPGCYLDAVLQNTKAMWFPGGIADGYQEIGIASYMKYEKSYFNFSDSIAQPGNHAGWLTKICAFYRNIGLQISYEKIPVISMLFSIGFQVWMLLNALFYSLYRKAKAVLLPLIILLIYTLILAFVPLVLLRYFAALFFTAPLVWAWTLQSPKHKNTK